MKKKFLAVLTASSIVGSVALPLANFEHSAKALAQEADLVLEAKNQFISWSKYKQDIEQIFNTYGSFWDPNWLELLEQPYVDNNKGWKKIKHDLGIIGFPKKEDRYVLTIATEAKQVVTLYIDVTKENNNWKARVRGFDGGPEGVIKAEFLEDMYRVNRIPETQSNTTPTNTTPNKKGWIQENGSWYLYDNNGAKVKNAWSGNYYLGSDGKMMTNKWIYDNSYKAWYFLKVDGSYAKNEWIGNYYLEANGKMATNKWIGKYHVNNSGYWDKTKTTGWVKENGAWYLHDNNGEKVKNAWSGNYYLGNDGKMVSNKWIYDNSYKAWYFLKADGSYAKNEWIGNYYLEANGKMATNKWIGKYHVNNSGYWDKTKPTGWVKENGAWYLYDNNGEKVKNAWSGNYYLGSDGKMITNAWVDNNRYYVGNDGAWIKDKKHEIPNTKPTTPSTKPIVDHGKYNKAMEIAKKLIGENPTIESLQESETLLELWAERIHFNPETMALSEKVMHPDLTKDEANYVLDNIKYLNIYYKENAPDNTDKYSKVVQITRNFIKASNLSEAQAKLYLEVWAGKKTYNEAQGILVLTTPILSQDEANYVLNNMEIIKK